MKCLRSTVGPKRLDKVRNEVVRRRAGIYRALRWLGLLEIMGEYCMSKMESMPEVREVRLRGRKRLGCVGSVMVALSSTGMTTETAQQCAAERG